MDNHIPVLLNESISLLDIKDGGTYVDLTFGRGGHSSLILEKIGKQGKLIAFDMDLDAISYGKAKFKDDPRVTFIHSSLVILPS